MAPGANQLMVEGDSCNTQLQGVQPLFDAQLAVLSGHGNRASASIESNSWAISGGETFPKIYARTSHAINLRAAAEGVGMYFSSGDSPRFCTGVRSLLAGGRRHETEPCQP